MKLLYKQNVVDKTIEWTAGYGDMSKHRKATSSKDGGWRMGEVIPGVLGSAPRHPAITLK